MRILWHSNAPHCPSGYGVQTAMHTQQLQELGHDLAISALWGLDDGVIMHAGPKAPIPVLPKGKLPQGLLADHAREWGADVIIPHYDVWTFANWMPHIWGGKPFAPWFPVDTEEMPPASRLVLAEAVMRIAQTRHGQQATIDAELDCEYVPAAYYGGHYRFQHRDMAREAWQKDDRFVVGVVSANRSISHSIIRKAFPQIVEGFAKFKERHPGAVLYFHARRGAEEGGIELGLLCAQYGLTDDDVLFSPPYWVDCGLEPGLMAGIYSAFDVLLCPSMGEGFGVPIIEAQACGTPVVVGGWTAMEELALSGVAIPKTSAYKYLIPGYGNQWLVEPDAVADALEEVATQKWDRDEVAKKVAGYEINAVAETYWPPVLEELERRIGKPKPHPEGNRAARRAAKRKVKLTDAVAA